MGRKSFYKLGIVLTVVLFLIIAIKYMWYVMLGILGIVTFIVFAKIVYDAYRMFVLEEDFDIDCGFEEIDE